MTSTPPSETFGVLLQDYQKTIYDAMRKAQAEGKSLFLLSPGRMAGKQYATSCALALESHKATDIIVTQARCLMRSIENGDVLYLTAPQIAEFAGQMERFSRQLQEWNIQIGSRAPEPKPPTPSADKCRPQSLPIPSVETSQSSRAPQPADGNPPPRTDSGGGMEGPGPGR